MSGVINFANPITVTVSSAGTAVQVTSTSTNVTSFEVHCPAGNTGSVFVGNSSILNSTGAPIAKGTAKNFSTGRDSLMDSITDSYDLSLIYIDAANSGDTAIVTYFERVAHP